MKKIAILCLTAVLLLAGCSQEGTQKKLQVEKNPVVTITMENGGVIQLELYYDVAPNTVTNFISLIQQGYYDGVIFHRVVPGFVIQGGDPSGTGRGSPGYRIKGEFTNAGFENTLKHERGVLSMARQGNPYDPASAYHTGGSQFFIMLADNASLDGDYAAFGRVTSGMEVVDEIAATELNESTPVTPQVMKTVTVDTFGVDFGQPETIKE